MNDRLFPFLLALTLLDLAFVHATGVVADLSLLPLWLLAAASPWLRRLQVVRGCRVTWNTVVLLVFALLVHHATTTGLLYMLEDGLLLAVLCQVHLLNNVGEKQRPDLVFFNSFLVAFVTSFFAPDLGWSLLFVAHAFVFVPALQTNVLTRRGTPPRDLMPTLVRESIGRTVTIGALTAVVFVSWPRDFQRQGWLGEALATPEQMRTGIADQIRLGDEFSVRLGEGIVMRLEPASGQIGDVPTHWRAIAFSTFDGASWLPIDVGRTGRPSTDPPWERAPDGSWRRGPVAAGAEVRVRLLDRSSRCMPTPLHANNVDLERAADVLVDPKPWGVLGLLHSRGLGSGSLDYTVRLGTSPPATVPARVRRQLSGLPSGGIPAIATDLANRLRDRLPANADDGAIAHVICDWLREHRRYSLPGEPGFAQNLGEFLIGTGTGHCEYFATALAVLLRTRGIPCRVVGGYLAHETDPDGRSVVVRARHAHAWVEMLRADGTWETFDATPPADVMTPATDTGSWWQSTREQLADLWSAVVSFDGKRRGEWLRSIVDFPESHPGVVILALASLVGLLYRRSRRRQTVPAIVQLERAARRAGLAWRNGETPRELLARATASNVEPRRIAALLHATERHEAARYGGRDGEAR